MLGREERSSSLAWLALPFEVRHEESVVCKPTLTHSPRTEDMRLISWTEHVSSPHTDDAPAAFARAQLLVSCTCRASHKTLFEASSDCHFRAALVYLHGFPDMSVCPAGACGRAYSHEKVDASGNESCNTEERVHFASRFPRKLADAVLGEFPDCLFVCFNASGLPGSDAGPVRFRHKLVSREVLDAIAVLRHVRCNYLGGMIEVSPDYSPKDSAPLYVVGLSTGAIIATLLRDMAIGRGLGPLSSCTWREPHLRLCAIAGLLDEHAGLTLDFDKEQRDSCEARGWCWKEFYLPAGYRHTDAGCDFEQHSATNTTCTHGCDGSAVPLLYPPPSDGASSPPLNGKGSYKCYLRLNRTYLDEFRNGTLSVARSVSAVCSTGVPPPPLLVIHGEADRSVPYANGEALFVHAAPPKRMLSIKKANHLLSNSTHFRKATNEIILFMHEHK